MLHVLNTRPAERADGLNHALQQAGYRVSQLPLLELVAEPFEAIQPQLSKIWQVAVVVVVSPAAAQLGLAGLKQLDILPSQLACQWVAVGQGTAAILAQAGITAQVPALETSEGMLALDIFQQAQHSTASCNKTSDSAAAGPIMFWRGHGGRQFMLKQLASQQQVISLNLYDRQLPKSSKAQYQQLLNHPPQVLIITSGVSWQYWLELGQQFGAMTPPYILVLGPRIYQKICQQTAHMTVTTTAYANTCHANSPKVILLENLNPASILAMLDQLQKCQQT
ncbi:uroporphyrinogen-III synthase [Alkanindiges illinoisensis]|uniref:Uroporphyrinogen-III synthase n=1 Tax=Alkanindiges illinoisensis TaxID=197183 RepID=A0A4Y7XDC8_9GAMM|nr:uroporphyrinogen-III synthase [Alkanindiges illinoisensis]TEU28518.1 uroporphyrinogen-III synthase [Alkanindiges illinoisensis]